MKRSQIFDDMGSLQIIWRLIKRHQMFLLTAGFIIENVYLLVTSVG